MLVTIIAVWAIVLPLTILAASWQAARLREDRGRLTAASSVPAPASHAGSLPDCARRAARPRRTLSRRVCPELPGDAGRRPASA
jgi:hypothetical protein